MKILLFAILLMSVLTSCSTRKAPEVYAEAQKAEAGKNVDLALERYEEVVREFPTEALAESSLYRVVMIRSNVDGDKRKVVDAQMKFLELFPQSERVPTIVFMMAFVYNNELGNVDSARKYYKRFVETWPDNELAPSARFELETLGQTPEELIGGTPAGGERAATPGGSPR